MNNKILTIVTETGLGIICDGSKPIIKRDCLVINTEKSKMRFSQRFMYTTGATPIDVVKGVEITHVKYGDELVNVQDMEKKVKNIGNKIIIEFN